MTEEVLPCAHCGSTDVMRYGENGVLCFSCRSSSVDLGVWNLRAFPLWVKNLVKAAQKFKPKGASLELSDCHSLNLDGKCTNVCCDRFEICKALLSVPDGAKETF